MIEEMFNNLIVEKKDVTAVKYILQGEDIFYDIGFRVMKNLQNDVLLSCHKAKYNGKNELVYFTDNLVPLDDKIRVLDPEKIGTLLSNLFHAICTIEENGFINVSCVDNRLDRIYIEEGTNKVKLIYLPVACSAIQNDKAIFENEVRTRLIKLLRGIAISENARVQNLVYILMDGTLKMEELARKIREGCQGVNVHMETNYTTQSVNKVVQRKQQMRTLEIVSEDKRIRFLINKPEFIIGKSVEMAEGVIQGNPAVSRKHCKVVLRNDGYYIQDLGSANGTFVDGMCVTNQQAIQLKQGSQIIIANMQFRANYI